MKKLISRRKFLAAMGTMAAAGALTACGGSSSGTASSAAASSTAASAAESWGDVKLTMWGAEEDQTMLREMADAFIEQNADKGNVTIEIGVQSESSAKDTVLADPESAADVFAFADDQLNELVNAGALQEVLLNPDDVKSRNLPGSVGAATMNDKLYAYPMTADNGYFLYYDASVLSAEDVQSVDTMLEKAAAAGKKFMMSVNDAWYIYSFYAGAGLVATLADDGINTVCNWNEAPGADVTQAILDITANPGFKSGADADIVSAIKDGSCCAAISGTWNASTAEEAWGEGYARHQAANLHPERRTGPDGLLLWLQAGGRQPPQRQRGRCHDAGRLHHQRGQPEQALQRPQAGSLQHQCQCFRGCAVCTRHCRTGRAELLRYPAAGRRKLLELRRKSGRDPRLRRHAGQDHAAAGG